MKILKYSYICMFSATAGIMTACAPDGQEGCFPERRTGDGEIFNRYKGGRNG